MEVQAELQAEQETRGEKIAQGIYDGLRTLIVDNLEKTEDANDEEKPVTMAIGVEALLLELAAAKERVENAVRTLSGL